jgi:BirA family biotin operon repressor/biotin-[acetyl-CoA-carboxylase] ligase
MVTWVTGERARSALATTRFADVRWITETGSTNTDLAAAARSGAPEGVVLVADHQTGGRGRLGRVWQAPPGSSLLCSVLCRPSLEPDRLSLVTMALGVAAAEACSAVAGVPAGLKWPNDLVVANAPSPVKKLGGMLSESVVEGGRLDAVVLGIGVNVNWPTELPDELRDIAVALNHLVGDEVDREGLLIAMLERFDALYDGVAGGGDGAAVLTRYRTHSVTLGARVRVDTAAEALTGRAADLAEDGILVLELDDGRRKVVTAGDVTHLRPT